MKETRDRQLVTTRLEDYPVLILGDARPAYLKALSHTVNPAQPFEAVLVASEVSEETVYSALMRGNRLLAPILNLSGSHLPREDFFHPVLSEESLKAGLMEVGEIVRRVAELPEVSRQSDRPQLLALALAYTRDQPIEARLSPDLPDLVDYPLLRGIADPRAILDDLAYAQLVRPRFFERLHFCGRCGSSRLIVREECSECRSSHLEEGSLVHHYRCGYQGPESQFRQDSELECPKCRRTLRHYGVDYDKPGSIQHCLHCGHTMSEPAVGFLCIDCGYQQDASSTDTRDWLHYDLLPAAVDALGSGVLPYRSLAQVMTRSFGAASVRDFTVAVGMLSRVSDRYKRPLAAFQLRIQNTAELRDKLGGRGVSVLFSTLGEIVSQILRGCDLITATNHAIFALLPETSPDSARIAVSRIEEGLRTSIAEPIHFEVSIYSVQDLNALLEALE